MGVDTRNPGSGVPEAIRSIAGVRAQKAGVLRTVFRQVEAAAESVSGSNWRGEAQRAFSASMTRVAPDLLLLAGGLDAQAEALRMYAGQVERIKDEQAALASRRSAATEAVERARSLLARSHQVDDRVLAQEAATGFDVRSSEIRASRSRIEDTIASEERRLRQIQTDWDELVHRRRQADAACVAALVSKAVLGLTAPFSPAAVRTRAPGDLLQMLAGLSASDLAALLAGRPELAARLAELDPTDVSEWWSSLDDEGDGLSQAQSTLLVGAPTVIGALDGLPPMVRVAANRLNAQERLLLVRDELGKLRERVSAAGSRSPFDLSVPPISDDQPQSSFDFDPHRAAEIARLEAEAAYLESAVAGAVQLYLYEPAASRIIEMIGTPSELTRHVVTYVPGTFTSLHDFYAGGVQQVGSHLVEGRNDTVAFVVKDGLFPGEHSTGAVDFTRILEANDQSGARIAGDIIARFQAGLRIDPDLRHATHVAIGHSWGLSAVTASEMSGARYHTVVSLSGAWMPKGWGPTGGTAYLDLSYDDALQHAQRLGAVGNGNVPRAHPAFEFGEYYRAPGDVFADLPTGLAGPPGIVVRSPGGATSEPERNQVNLTNLITNHNLIATDDEVNRPVLDALAEAAIGK